MHATVNLFKNIDVLRYASKAIEKVGIDAKESCVRERLRDGRKETKSLNVSNVYGITDEEGQNL